MDAKKKKKHHPERRQSRCFIVRFTFHTDVEEKSTADGKLENGILLANERMKIFSIARPRLD